MCKKILIVEDDYINRLVFVEIVKHDGYDYKVARDEWEAIEMLKNHSFALIMLDLRMPPHGYDSGFEILKKKVKIKKNKDTKVLIITAALDEKTIDERIKDEYNVTNILFKPVENNAISKAVCAVIGDNFA